jgi:DNA-binding NarL/FixJ family response regulator
MTSYAVKPTIVLADDHAGILSKICEILGESFVIMAQLNDGIATIEAALRLVPDILILDITMPHLDGIRTAREVRRLGLQSKIIFLTIQVDADYIDVANEIGAGFVLKPKMCTDLLPAIDAALHGERFVSSLPLSGSSSRLM